MENSDTAKLIRIHPEDNVGVLAQSVVSGQVIQFGNVETTADGNYALGHKFALEDISQGSKILKYGISIGSATESISKGAHVHLHNLQSDYLPTFTLDEERNFEG